MYAELLTFLTNSPYDVAVILESKGQECMEYTTGPWSYIPSGCKTRKQAGVLVLVHQRVTVPSQLRFEHVLQGRLLHVRVPLPGKDARHCHVIGVYQKAYARKCSSMLEQRSQVWQALDRCLARVEESLVRYRVILPNTWRTCFSSCEYTALLHLTHGGGLHHKPKPQPFVLETPSPRSTFSLCDAVRLPTRLNKPTRSGASM